MIAPRLQRLADSVERVREMLRAYEWAVENIDFMSAASDADVIAATSPYPVIFAVFVDPTTSEVVTRRIKGREGGELVRANAIPVADVDEAHRWAAILNSNAAPPTSGEGPRLATVNGARLDGEAPNLNRG